MSPHVSPLWVLILGKYWLRSFILLGKLLRLKALDVSHELDCQGIIIRVGSALRSSCSNARVSEITSNAVANLPWGRMLRRISHLVFIILSGSTDSLSKSLKLRILLWRGEIVRSSMEVGIAFLISALAIGRTGVLLLELIVVVLFEMGGFFVGVSSESSVSIGVEVELLLSTESVRVAKSSNSFGPPNGEVNSLKVVCVLEAGFLVLQVGQAIEMLGWVSIPAETMDRVAAHVTFELFRGPEAFISTLKAESAPLFLAKDRTVQNHIFIR